jgi:Uma2 family endonuclease
MVPSLPGEGPPVAPHELRRDEVRYPESDGKPMAETDLHRDLMVDAIDAVRERFRADPSFYASGNLFVYFEEGNPGAVVAPDFFAVRGVPAGRRRIYKVWEEGKGPEVVLELTSPSTHREDLGNKRAIYEDLGVREYFIFDPFAARSRPALRGFGWKDGVLQPVAPLREEGEKIVHRSEVLGLELHGGGGSVRWVDPATGRPLPTRDDLRRRAEAESRRAEAAEAELLRLRAEIERLRQGAG